MSEPKFTKGPWKIDRWRDNKNGSSGIRIETAGGIGIANIIGQLDDRELANAKILAAAPDLYAACQETIETLNLVDPGVYGDLISTIEAALAKAEGKQ